MLTLFEKVLLLVPEPLRVDFTEVLDQKSVLSNALAPIAKDAQAFRMDPEVGIVLTLQIRDGFENHPGELLLHVAKFDGVLLLRPQLQIVVA